MTRDFAPTDALHAHGLSVSLEPPPATMERFHRYRVEEQCAVIAEQAVSIKRLYQRAERWKMAALALAAALAMVILGGG